MDFPDVLLSTRETAVAVSRAVRAGRLRKIGSRLYTSRVDEDPASIVAKHRWPIVGLYAPGAVISYRTALEGKPAADGTVFLSAKADRTIQLPGLTIRSVRGPGPLEGDREFIGGLYFASRERALLDSLRPSRARATVARGLSPNEIEELLDRELAVHGETRLNQIRDRAHALAQPLDAAAELEALTKLIATMLGSRPGSVRTASARARQTQPPYDPDRLATFERLHSALLAPLPLRPDPAPPSAGAAFRNAAFLDAYFSNFIEGTEFQIDEAREMVFEGKIHPQRPADSHDVLGTYRLVGDEVFLAAGVTTLTDAAEFEARVRLAHASIMGGRPETQPGELKTRVNRAGNSVFVEPALVRGTLAQGFAVARSLENAFARAAAVMFVISDVHPFADGNGRVARAMMNAELVSAGLCRVLIPTVYREDYLGALRNLTRQREPDAFIAMLDYAQRVTAWVDYAALDRAIAMLRRCHAFDDESVGTRLRIPTQDDGSVT